MNNPASVKLSSFNGVVALAADNVWTAGGGEYGPLIGHWDGQTWQEAVYKLQANSGYLRAIAASGPSDLWAVGSKLPDSITKSAPLILHGDGQTWQDVSSGFTAAVLGLQSVVALAPNDVWVAADDSRTPVVYHWDGSVWQAVALPLERLDYGLTLGGQAPNDIWAVGATLDKAKTSTLTLHWDGQHWEQVPSPNPGAQHNNLRAVSTGPAGVWASGYSGDNPNAQDP
jgi:hypothetical protein